MDAEDLMEDSVDPETYVYVPTVTLEVNIGRIAGHRTRQQVIDDLDGRRIFARRRASNLVVDRHERRFVPSQVERFVDLEAIEPHGRDWPLEEVSDLQADGLLDVDERNGDRGVLLRRDSAQYHQALTAAERERDPSDRSRVQLELRELGEASVGTH